MPPDPARPDVTQRDRVEAAVRPAHEPERGRPSLPIDVHLAVLDASPNAIVAVGRDGRIAYANPRVSATFGHDPSSLIGMPVESLIPTEFHERHRAHRDGFMKAHGARPMGIGLDLRARRLDGSEFPVEISLAPVDSDEGILVFATIVDITSRKLAEDALSESERRFRAVLEASPNAIVGVRRDGTIVYANPRVGETFGWPRDELVGRSVDDLLPDHLVDRHAANRAGFVSKPAARPMGIGLDLRARRQDGTDFPVEISLSPVETPDGPIVFATIVDITGRKSLESQLMHAQKMESIGRLAGGIAHDFNNMLSAIGGFADLLIEDLSAPQPPAAAELRVSVDAIRSATDRAIGLTSQLLAFSRKQVMSPRLLDLAVSIRDLEPMLRRLIGEQIELVLRLAPDTGNIRSDPGQIDQVLMNLVVNARDAVDGVGTITIETRDVQFDQRYVEGHFDVSAGDYVMLVVSDTGRGMDQATKDRIFEPYFTTKDRGSGTGLGLSTTFGIVQQSGGRIWVYSEPGQGTTFKLYFPRDEGHVSATSSAEASTGPAGRGTVLVVEDESVVRDYTVRVLDRAGYVVAVASSGEEAMRLLDGGLEISMLVTDVVMPGITGTVLANRVIDRDPRIGVVLLSGYTEETLDLAAILERGATFLPKPYAPGQLTRALASAVELAAVRGRPSGDA